MRAPPPPVPARSSSDSAAASAGRADAGPLENTPALVIADGRLPLLCGASVGLFFGLMFAVRSGYSYGAALLLLTSIWLACAPSYRRHRASRVLARDDW